MTPCLRSSGSRAATSRTGTNDRDLSPRVYLKMEPKADTSNGGLLLVCFQRRIRDDELEQ
jgi:hypothetical protein